MRILVSLQQRSKAFSGECLEYLRVLLAVGAVLLCSGSVQAELSSELIRQYRLGPAWWPPFEVDSGVQAQEIGPLPAVEVELENPRVRLGRTLFFDPRLSASGQIACAQLP